MNAMELVSLALRHPDAELLAAREEIAREAAALPPSPGADALTAFASWWAAEPATELARSYVETFDFSRRTALDLTWYTHGDRRQRGLRLLALRERYAAAGWDLEGPELPDHLPVVLEFAACDPEEGRALLGEMRPAIELLRAGLERAGSPYARLLEAICLMLPEPSEADRAEVRRMALEGPPAESVGLEPFAPPEVMPDPVRAAAAPCALAGRRGRA
jgi:nitrate reductase delta subunit